MTSTASVNPLNYWCPPNGCTPEYIPASSIEDFLAYGVLRCWIDPRDTICQVTLEDVADLREAFLNAVESAVMCWREQEIGKPIGSDPAEPTVIFDLPDGDYCLACWIWERVDEDALLFILAFSGSDDLAIWFSRESIEGKEPEAVAAIEAARRVLGLTTEVRP